MDSSGLSTMAIVLFAASAIVAFMVLWAPLGSYDAVKKILKLLEEERAKK